MSSTFLKFFSRPLCSKNNSSSASNISSGNLPPVGSFVEIFFFSRAAKLSFFRGVVVSISRLRHRVTITNYNHRVTMTFCVKAPSFGWTTVIRFPRGGKRIRKFS